MIDLLTLLIINALYILGLYNSTAFNTDVDSRYDAPNSEILGFLGYYGEKLPQWLYKPLIGCIICMGSIHSFPFWFIYDFTLLNGFIWILYIFALSGLNLIIYERIIEG